MFDRLLYIKGAKKAVVLVASLFFVFMLIVNLYYIDSFEDRSVFRVLLYTFINFVIPILFLPLIIRASLRVPLFRDWSNVIMHLIMSLIYVAIFVFLVRFFLLAVNGYFLFSEPIELIISALNRQFLVSGSMAFLTYWGIVVLSGMQVYYVELDEVVNRADTLEEQLAKATLSTLKAQLKPHFLFNTLNMIDFHLHTDYKKAVNTLEKLEDLLKTTFDQHQPNNCTIEAEINFINQYLEIEKSRFGERLKVELSIDEETKPIQIPSYLVQPLVENSIKHGVSKSLQDFEISICSYMNKHNLVIEILDDGSSSTLPKKKKKWGIGLRNIDERLKLFFGPDALLETGFLAQKGFRSAIIIPKKYIRL